MAPTQPACPATGESPEPTVADRGKKTGPANPDSQKSPPANSDQHVETVTARERSTPAAGSGDQRRNRLPVVLSNESCRPAQRAGNGPGPAGLTSFELMGEHSAGVWSDPLQWAVLSRLEPGTACSEQCGRQPLAEFLAQPLGQRRRASVVVGALAQSPTDARLLKGKSRGPRRRGWIRGRSPSPAGGAWRWRILSQRVALLLGGKRCWKFGSSGARVAWPSIAFGRTGAGGGAAAIGMG